MTLFVNLVEKLCPECILSCHGKLLHRCTNIITIQYVYNTGLYFVEIENTFGIMMLTIFLENLKLITLKQRSIQYLYHRYLF